MKTHLSIAVNALENNFVFQQIVKQVQCDLVSMEKNIRYSFCSTRLKDQVLTNKASFNSQKP